MVEDMDSSFEVIGGEYTPAQDIQVAPLRPISAGETARIKAKKKARVAAGETVAEECDSILVMWGDNRWGQCGKDREEAPAIARHRFLSKYESKDVDLDKEYIVLVRWNSGKWPLLQSWSIIQYSTAFTPIVLKVKKVHLLEFRILTPFPILLVTRKSLNSSLNKTHTHAHKINLKTRYSLLPSMPE